MCRYADEEIRSPSYDGYLFKLTNLQINSSAYLHIRISAHLLLCQGAFVLL